MFGRRRRAAPVLPVPTVPRPELSDDQVFELLHAELDCLVGPHGLWTLVPRTSGDTDVIFHGLKARQLASSLVAVLRRETALLRGESSGEPAALSFTPAPITVWAEPDAAGTPIRAGEPRSLAGYTAAQPRERQRLVA